MCPSSMNSSPNAHLKIRSRKDYLIYNEADRVALGRKRTLARFLFDDIWKFQKRLRYLEYLQNSERPLFLRRVRVLIAKYRHRRLGVKLGFTIPPNVFGPGLAIAHVGTIIVSDGAIVGSNCRLHCCVNIGTKGGESATAPTIGNNCYIAPGAKLYGDIVIGDNIAIGANAVVNRDFPAGDMTIGGVPARVLSDKGSKGLVTEGLRRSKASGLENDA